MPDPRREYSHEDHPPPPPSKRSKLDCSSEVHKEAETTLTDKVEETETTSINKVEETDQSSFATNIIVEEEETGFTSSSDAEAESESEWDDDDDHDHDGKQKNRVGSLEFLQFVESDIVEDDDAPTCSDIVPITDLQADAIVLTYFSDLSLHCYNDLNNAKYKFLKVLETDLGDCCCSIAYYIRFEAATCSSSEEPEKVTITMGRWIKVEWRKRMKPPPPPEGQQIATSELVRE